MHGAQAFLLLVENSGSLHEVPVPTSYTVAKEARQRSWAFRDLVHPLSVSNMLLLALRLLETATCCCCCCCCTPYLKQMACFTEQGWNFGSCTGRTVQICMGGRAIFVKLRMLGLRMAMTRAGRNGWLPVVAVCVGIGVLMSLQPGRSIRRGARTRQGTHHMQLYLSRRAR